MIRPKPESLQVCLSAYVASPGIRVNAGLDPSNVQSLGHAEENEDENNAIEDGSQFENPSPAEILADETTDNRGEVVAVDHSHSVDAHGSTSLVEEEEIDDGDSAKSKGDWEETVEDAGNEKLRPGFGIRSSKN